MLTDHHSSSLPSCPSEVHLNLYANLCNILSLTLQLSACVSSIGLSFISSMRGILFASTHLIILGTLCQTLGCSALTRNALDRLSDFIFSLIISRTLMLNFRGYLLKCSSPPGERHLNVL